MEQDPKPPLIHPPQGPSGSPGLSPSGSLQLLIELLRPAGIELARRWVAALVLVPESDRAAVVEAVERQITREFAGNGAGGGIDPDELERHITGGEDPDRDEGTASGEEHQRRSDRS